LGFDLPGERRPVVFFQDCICAKRVLVFGIEKEAVHVKETGSNGRETMEGLVGLSGRAIEGIERS
jgi:hypothetical protein